MERILSIDIGSTYTKGALFQLEDGRLSLLDYAKTPTTVAHLKEGFDRVRAMLDPDRTVDSIAFSSSAKGGLAIAAIGLVPDLTLKIAKLAALSAGGKVLSARAYKLASQHLDELAKERPEIILLAGGTDGGNESYVRHNAEALRGLPARMPGLELPSVIYAGNAVLQEDVLATLREAGFEVTVAPNLMPQMDEMTPEGAREQIREVFLKKIVHGKGLDEIVAEVGCDPMPTPLAVLNLVEAIREEAPDFGDFMLVDMGGATTDVYSSGETPSGEARVVHRGVRDPEVKRSVEGDLGMRVSARVAASACRTSLRQALGAGHEAFEAYVNGLPERPDHLPEPGSLEDGHDRALASACIHHALVRHAGTWKRVFTAAGETFLQHGKNLRGITKVIGSGGFLSALPDFQPTVMSPDPRQDTYHLVPTRYTYLRDRGYLLPILGNLALRWRKPAVQAALDGLDPMGEIQGPDPLADLTGLQADSPMHC